MTDLIPGSTYIIEVQAYKGDNLGKPVSVFINTPGKAIPAVKGLKGLLFNNTVVKLAWEEPKDSRINKQNVQYAVHYGLKMEEIFKGLNNQYRVRRKFSLESFICAP